MGEVASSAVTEATRGILEKIPGNTMPYLVMVIVVCLLCVAFIFILYKFASKTSEKAIEEVRKSYDSIIKSQQDTIHDLIQGNSRKEEEK